jgi:THO complex subunit Tho7-like protein
VRQKLVRWRNTNENGKDLVSDFITCLYMSTLILIMKDDEHETLISQIEELKTALEHAQMLRRRKIEYDLVAEKVNTLPSREELESYVF